MWEERRGNKSVKTAAELKGAKVFFLPLNTLGKLIEELLVFQQSFLLDFMFLSTSKLHTHAHSR